MKWGERPPALTLNFSVTESRFPAVIVAHARYQALCDAELERDLVVEQLASLEAQLEVRERDLAEALRDKADIRAFVQQRTLESP